MKVKHHINRYKSYIKKIQTHSPFLALLMDPTGHSKGLWKSFLPCKGALYTRKVG